MRVANRKVSATVVVLLRVVPFLTNDVALLAAASSECIEQAPQHPSTVGREASDSLALGKLEAEEKPKHSKMGAVNDASLKAGSIFGPAANEPSVNATKSADANKPETIDSDLGSSAENPSPVLSGMTRWGLLAILWVVLRMHEAASCLSSFWEAAASTIKTDGPVLWQQTNQTAVWVASATYEYSAIFFSSLSQCFGDTINWHPSVYLFFVVVLVGVDVLVPRRPWVTKCARSSRLMVTVATQTDQAQGMIVLPHTTREDNLKATPEETGKASGGTIAKESPEVVTGLIQQ